MGRIEHKERCTCSLAFVRTTFSATEAQYIAEADLVFLRKKAEATKGIELQDVRRLYEVRESQLHSHDLPGGLLLNTCSVQRIEHWVSASPGCSFLTPPALEFSTGPQQ